MGKVKIIILCLLISLLFISLYSLVIKGLTFDSFRQTKMKKVIIVDGEEKPKNPLQNNPLYYLGIFKKLPLSVNRDISIINHAAYSGLGIAMVDGDNNFISWLPEAELKDIGEGELKSAGEILDWWMYDNFDKNSQKELAAQFGIAGTAMVHPFYLYSYDGERFELLLKLIEANSKAEVKDLNGDGIKEIIHEYSLSGIGKLERDLLRWKDIWQVKNGKPVKVNYQFPRQYEDLINLYNVSLNKKDWVPDVNYYYQTLYCLKEKAEATIQKKQIEIKNCQELLRKRYEQPNT